MSERIALLSDIHANLPALRACLTNAAELGATRVLVCGDIIGDGPFPRETIDLLRSHPATEVIRGNVDRKILRQSRRKPRRLKKLLLEGNSARRNRIWTALELGKDHLDWLAALPPTLTLTVDGQVIVAVHGSPRSDTDYIYPSLTAEGLRQKLEGVAPRPKMLACGHSHVPFSNRVEGICVVNCGSVGRPADGDPRGSFALAEISKEKLPSVRIVRFAYPLRELEKALSTGRVPGISMVEYEMGIKL